ncbi:uncharacterized protein V1518DRAFT_421358 [Limtongia smithiae]|uniref:uncharacterized protein n=1 Tax=Limtongia smithiae TaxID=1125753 RepID=UPI0034CD0C97
MRPPWLPQNIQNRLARYILTKVAVIGEPDLADLDVQIASKHSISLQNLRLNVEAVSIPGMQLQDGVVGKIEVKFTSNFSTGFIEVTLSNVVVTGRPSPSISSIEDSLPLAPSDLAMSYIESESPARKIELEQSILHLQDEDDARSAEKSDDEDEVGYGPGFAGTTLHSYVTKFLNHAKDHVVIIVNNLSVRTILDGLVLEGSIVKAEFKTDQNRVHVLSLSDIQFSLPPSAEDTELPLKENSAVSERHYSHSIYGSSDSSNESSSPVGQFERGAFDLSNRRRVSNQSGNSLSESTIFTSEEAHSIYYSALGSSEVNGSNTPTQRSLSSAVSGNGVLSSPRSSPRMLWCDRIDVRLSPLLSETEVQFGVIKSSLAQMEPVANALIRLTERFLGNYEARGQVAQTTPAYFGNYETPSNSSVRTTPEGDGSKKIKIGIQRFEICPVSDLDKDGQYVSMEKTVFVLQHIYALISQSYSKDDLHNPYSTNATQTTSSIVKVDSITAMRSGHTILSFSQADTSIPDITLINTPSKCALEISKPLEIVANMDALEEIALFSNTLSGVLNSLQHSSLDWPSRNNDETAKSDFTFSGKLNNIHLVILTSRPDATIDIVIKPLALIGSNVKSDGIEVKIPGTSVHLHDLAYEVNPKKQYDMQESPEEIHSRKLAAHLSFSRMDLECTSLGLLSDLIQSLSKDFQRIGSMLNSPARAPSRAIPPPLPSRVRFHESKPARPISPGQLVSVSDVVLLLKMPDTIGDISFALTKLRIASFFSEEEIKVDVRKLSVTRLTPYESDEEEDQFELVGPVLDNWAEGRYMLQFSVRKSREFGLRLYNMRFEYRYDFVALLVSALSSTKEKEPNAEQVAQSIFGIRRPDSPWDYEFLTKQNDSMRSEIDDEDYADADDDYGPKRPSVSSLSASIATLKANGPYFEYDMRLRDCAIGLNPLGAPSKGLLVITDGTGKGCSNNSFSDTTFELQLRRATLFLIDDVKHLHIKRKPSYFHHRVKIVEHLTPFADMGYVNVSSISSASLHMRLIKDESTTVEVRDDLLFIESCADSTQTLLEVINGLGIAAKASTEDGDEVGTDSGQIWSHTSNGGRKPLDQSQRYKVEVPSIDVLASVDPHAFARGAKMQSPPRHDALNNYVENSILDAESYQKSSPDTELKIQEAVSLGAQVESYYNEGTSDRAVSNDELIEPESFRTSDITSSTSIGSPEPETLLEFDDLQLVDEPSSKNALLALDDDEPVDAQLNDDIRDAINKIEILEEHFGRKSLMETSILYGQQKLFTINVRDVHVLWNLHDGYDWPHTRELISKAVKKVENRALEALRRKHQGGPRYDSDDDSIIGDTLFNSIYIGVPYGNDPHDLTDAINREIDGNSETTSQVSSSFYSGRVPHSTSHRSGGFVPRPKLKLKRSRANKVQIELRGVSLEYISYAKTAVIADTMNLKVRDFEVFDNVPTSTWRKFATYMHSAGSREEASSMAHIEMLNVRPDPLLKTVDLVLKVNVLPLRLYVDQDVIDFFTRFFEFKDDGRPTSSFGVQSYFQRVEFKDINIKLDYKPKKVDYAGLRSGHTTEFANFFVLDESKIVLRSVVLYGILGFPRLFKELENIWLPDIQHTQLGDVLAGVAPVRSFVKLGGGLRDLIVVPVREYKKDGRVVRSIQKGARRFAKVTTNELVGMGAKLAVGTQSMLENAESLIVGQPSTSAGSGEGARRSSFDSSDSEDEGPKKISMYADQPTSIAEGLQRAYVSLHRNFGTAKQILVALPSEASEQGGVQKAAVAIARAAPVAVLRTMIGATEAVSNTLMGVNNQVDPQRRRNMEDKYKRR